MHSPLVSVWCVQAELDVGEIVVPEFPGSGAEGATPRKLSGKRTTSQARHLESDRSCRSTEGVKRPAVETLRFKDRWVGRIAYTIRRLLGPLFKNLGK